MHAFASFFVYSHTRMLFTNSCTYIQPLLFQVNFLRLHKTRAKSGALNSEILYSSGQKAEGMN